MLSLVVASDVNRKRQSDNQDDNCEYLVITHGHHLLRKEARSQAPSVSFLPGTEVPSSLYHIVPRKKRDSALTFSHTGENNPYNESRQMENSAGLIIRGL